MFIFMKFRRKYLDDRRKLMLNIKFHIQNMNLVGQWGK